MAYSLKTAVILFAAPIAPCPATCKEEVGTGLGLTAGLALIIMALWGMGWVFSRGWAAARDSWLDRPRRPRRVKIPKATAKERK